MSLPRACRLALLLSLAGCTSDPFSKALPDSYVLLVPAAKGTVRPAGVGDAEVQPLPRLFETGFLSEMLRTAYLASQLVRDGRVEGKPFPEPARALAKLPVVFWVGTDAPGGVGVTLAGGTFSSPQAFPTIRWIGIPSDPGADKALIQTVTGRIARFVGQQIVALQGEANTPAAETLLEGYGMAMEVVAREWRFRSGPAGVIQYDEGTKVQREVFADVRENHYVFKQGEKRLKSPAEMLSSPGIAATIIYRMAHSKGVGPKVAPPAFYAPFAKDRMPPGVNPAAILGPFRNFQAKFLSAWAGGLRGGKPVRDILDLVSAYGDAFPAERHEAVRIAVVTTYGACAKEGGVSPAAEDAQTALAELTAITAEIVAGKRSIRAAQGTAAPTE